MMKKGRSPAYPSIDLKTALERATELYSMIRNSWVPMETAIIDWGLKPKSSGSLLTIAALKYYGLLEDKGSGDERQVHLTDVGMNIIRDERPNSEERVRLIQSAALKPKVFMDLMNRFPGGRVSDETLRTYLKNNVGFLDEAANGVVKTFRNVLEFSGLDRLATQEDKASVREEKNMGVTIAPPSIISSSTYFLELPYRVGAETSMYSIKIPRRITWKDWEKMKERIEQNLREVIPNENPEESKE